MISQPPKLRAQGQPLRDSEQSRRQAAEIQAVLDAVPAAVFIARDPEAPRIDPNRAGLELLPDLDAREADNGPAAMEPHARNGDRLSRIAALDLQDRSGPEPLFWKICRRIDNDLPAIAVSARDASHQRHVVPGAHDLVVVGPHPHDVYLAAFGCSAMACVLRAFRSNPESQIPNPCF